MLKENFPNVKIYGNSTDKEKLLAKEGVGRKLNDFQEHLESFSSAYRETIKKKEIPLTSNEIAMTLLANAESNKLMEEVGVASFDVPIHNIHVLPRKDYQEIRGPHDSFAVAVIPEFGILMDKLNNSDPLVFSSHVFHEIMHLKGFLSLQLSEKNSEKNDYRETLLRAGVDVFSPQKAVDGGEYHAHFLGLNEAISSSEQKKYTKKLLETSEFKNDLNLLKSDEGRDAAEKICKSNHVDLDDIFFLNKKRRIYFSIGYRNQRKVLENICQEIASDIMMDKDDVYKEFLKSHFCGNLLSIAKLMEKSFGKGSFRELGFMGTDDESPIMTMEALKRYRLRELKRRKNL